MINLDAVNAFFNEHLLKMEYFAFDTDSRTAALRMAEADIGSELGRPPAAENFLELAAVSEQAIHLLRHPDGDAGSRLAAENVEGVGGRTYRNSPLPEIAPRARRYLRALLGATTPLARG